MHQSFVTTAPAPTYGDGQGIAGLMRGAVTFRVPQQCQVSAGLVIYPHGIYYYKEQGYDSQQVLAVQGFQQGSDGWWKVVVPTIPVWMDGWVRVLRPFNSISVISRRWKGEHERLCAMKHRLGSYSRMGVGGGSGYKWQVWKWQTWFDRVCSWEILEKQQP